MEPFEEAVRTGDAAAVRALLTKQPELRAAIDRPAFDTAPAIVFSRHDRAMVDTLLDFGADINSRSQFWGRTVGVLDDNTDDMRAYLISRGALPEISDFVAAVKAKDASSVRSLLTSTPALRTFIDRPLFHFGAQAIVTAKDDRLMVDTLLEFGANINARSDWWAGGFGVLDNTDPEQAAWLIDRGAPRRRGLHAGRERGAPRPGRRGPHADRARRRSGDSQRLWRHRARQLPMGLAEFPAPGRRLSGLRRGVAASRSAAVFHGFRQRGCASGVAATCRRESRVTKIIMMLFGALLAVSCTSPAVSKAVGTGADGATPIVVRTSESAVVVENHAGRPLLNVRITLTAPDTAKPFILVVPTLEIGATSEQPLTGFRSEDGTMLDPSAVHPTQVAITARDTLAKSYDVTVPWNR